MRLAYLDDAAFAVACIGWDSLVVVDTLDGCRLVAAGHNVVVVVTLAQIGAAVDFDDEGMSCQVALVALAAGSLEAFAALHTVDSVPDPLVEGCGRCKG